MIRTKNTLRFHHRLIRTRATKPRVTACSTLIFFSLTNMSCQYRMRWRRRKTRWSMTDALCCSRSASKSFSIVREPSLRVFFFFDLCRYVRCILRKLRSVFFSLTFLCCTTLARTLEPTCTRFDTSVAASRSRRSCSSS